MDQHETTLGSLASELNCSFDTWQLFGVDEYGDPPHAEWQIKGQESTQGIDLCPQQRCDLLNRTLEKQSCQVEPVGDGWFAIAIPVARSPGDRTVSLGIAKLDARQLCELVANHWQRWESDRVAVTQQQRCLDRFALQMSHKLEEITWLRRLSERLEVSNAVNRIEHVAADTFHDLAKVVRVESLALIKRLNQLPSTRETGLNVSSPVWIGKDFQHTDRFDAFLDCVTSIAGTKTLVWNRGGVSDRIPPHLVPEGIKSCLLVKVQTSLHDYGWILALNKIPDAARHDHDEDHINGEDGTTLGLDEFGTIEASLVEAAAGMLATHAANIELFEQQHDLTVSVIRSLINVVDARDSYTCGHSDRVALMARALAEQFGLDREVQEHVYLSGLLHDIGKVAIPDDILLKAGRLTSDEYAVIKEHPQCGVNILKHIKQLAPVLPGVLYHHESIDGSGYPHGLRGDDIPLMGRIIAIVDAFDAMTTNRPYRTARTQAEAVGILMEGAGSQWDARLINCFMEHFEKISGQARHWESHIAGLLADGAHDRLDRTALGHLHEANSLYSRSR